METNSFFLIKLDRKGNVCFGAENTYVPDDLHIADGINLESYSLPVTFKAVRLAMDVDPAEEQFGAIVDDLLKKRNEIRRQISENVELEATVTETGPRVLIRPDIETDNSFEYSVLRNSIADFNIVNALEPGDRLKVMPVRLGPFVYCKITEVISLNRKRETEMKLEREKRREQAILRKDLVTVSGKALWCPTVSEICRIETENKESFEVARLMDHDIEYNSTVKLKLFSIRPKVGNNVSLWIWPAKEDEYIQLNGKATHVRCEAILPDYIPEYSSKSGTVISHATESIVVTVSFDNNLWRNCVFRNRYNYKNRQWEPDPELEALIPKIVKYMPLGFDALFLTDFRVQNDTKEIKSRLKLCGFSKTIEGRVRDINRGQGMLERHVLASICGRKNAEVYYITSDEYAGRISTSYMPSALAEYAGQWIYTPEMRVPADVYLDKDNKVVFNVISALEEEKKSLESSIGQSLELKLCLVRNNNVYLTTEGGYPVVYTCRTEAETEYMRQNIFMKLKFRIDGMDGDRVSVIPSEFIDETIRKNELVEGVVFYADNIKELNDDMLQARYQNFPCIILKKSLTADDSVRTDTLQVMMIGFDRKRTSIMCIAHPELVNAPVINTRVLLKEELTQNLWSCSKKNRIMLMKTDRNESVLLRSILKTYGGPVTMAVSPVSSEETPIRMWVKSGHVVEDFNYKALLEEKVRVQCGITGKMPKVLYGDVVLTVPAESLSEKPVYDLIYTGEVLNGGELVCRLADNAEEKQSEGTATNQKDGIYGKVVSVTGKTVVFDIQGQQVSLSSDRQLHIPLRFAGALDRIFTGESSWAVHVENDVWQLDNRCPNWPMTYRIIGQLRYQQRPQMQRDWIVRSEDGKIGLVDGRGIRNVSSGSFMSLTLDEGAFVNENYTYLREADSSIEGKVLDMIFDSFCQEEKCIICHPCAAGFHGTYRIPLDDWSWGTRGMESLNCEHFTGALFKAKVVAVDGTDVIMNRKCLIEQHRLLTSSIVTGNYQMKVTGVSKKGYILRQSGVEALLPFDKAAWFSLDSSQIIHDYLPNGTLVEVFVSNAQDDTDSALVADLKTVREDDVMEWLGNSEEYALLPFTVCRIGRNYIFLEKKGVVLPLSTVQLREWQGCDLGAKYKVGQQFYDCVAEWHKETQSFKLQYNAEIKERPVPEIGNVYDAVITQYLEDEKCTCYVRFDRWTAVVRYRDMSWEPQPLGTRPYPVGSSHKIKVLEVIDRQSVIFASIKACQPRPETGPASEQAGQHPEIRRFKLKRYVDGNDKIFLMDQNNVPGILSAADAVRQLSVIARQFENTGDYIELPVIGLQDYRLRASEKVIFEKLSELEAELRLASSGRTILECIVSRVTNKYVFVKYGILTGRIAKEEAWWQNVVPLKTLYVPGQKVKCLVYETDATLCMFNASVIKADPDAINNLLPFKGTGEDITVRVIRYQQEKNYVLVSVNENIYGMLPVEEVSCSDIAEWTDRFKDDYIKVRVMDYEPSSCRIILSRRQILAPGIVE